MDLFSIRLDDILRQMTWRNILDVALVTAVIYYLLLLIRGTRAVQILLGLLVLVGAYYAAVTLELTALETILDRSFLVLPIVIIVLFQQEIRRALSSLWRAPMFSHARQQAIDLMVDDVTAAATTLAERKVGALIVFERQDGLREYIENGIQIDGLLSVDLLINLFTPDTPTHDGAVIVHDGRIAAATCFLPLTQNAELSKALGTRHRAALGITEETDALSVVVSEETGAISMAGRGNLERGLDAHELRNLLYARLTADSLQVESV